jgi:hypothetical protein
MKKPALLYHGSMKRVDILLSSQSVDWLSRDGNQCGVYATADREIALAFALGWVPDEAGNCSRMIKGPDKRMVFVDGRPNLGGKGYLYVLPPDRFRCLPGSKQWVCSEPVRPLEIIEINVDDYVHLFRYATDEEKRQARSDSWGVEDRRFPGDPAANTTGAAGTAPVPSNPLSQG